MPTMPLNVSGPHQGQPVYAAGQPLDQAAAVMILIHGRGGSPQGILGLSQDFERPELAYLAPQAAGSTWYPYSFLAPLEANQPGLDSGLQVIADIVAHVETAGIARENIIIGGFSQGACLAMEFLARNAGRWGGGFAFSGGVIGPPGSPRDYEGTFDNTPIFLGCSDIDSHIPLERVHETTTVFTQLSANVTEKIYPGMGHTTNADEIEHVRAIIDTLLAE